MQELITHGYLGFTLTSVTNLHQIYFITSDGICYSLSDVQIFLLHHRKAGKVIWYKSELCSKNMW